MKMPLLPRKLRSAHNRVNTYLQHLFFLGLEKTPAPWRFALRNFMFTHFAFLFAGTDPYSKWQEAVNYFIVYQPSKINIIDIQTVPKPHSLPPKKIAIQAHIFYPDLAAELAQVLSSFPEPFDLLISITDPNIEEEIRNQFKGISHLQNINILISPNRGRDIGPLLYGFGKQLLNYDYFAHIHTKKSSNTNDIGNEWRHYLINGLLSSMQGRTLKILKLLDEYGLIYPQKFPLIDVQNCQWGSNLKAANDLCIAMNVPPPTPGFIEFPAGSMFWAKTKALKPLLELPWSPEDFEPESGQTDQTIMHAIERCLTHVSLTQDYPIALLRYPSIISFYP